MLDNAHAQKYDSDAIKGLILASSCQGGPMAGSRSREHSPRWFAALLLILATLGSTLSLPAAAQSDLRYFSESGHFLRGAFRQFWERNGGVGTFGYPLTEEYF